MRVDIGKSADTLGRILNHFCTKNSRRLGLLILRMSRSSQIRVGTLFQRCQICAVNVVWPIDSILF